MKHAPALLFAAALFALGGCASQNGDSMAKKAAEPAETAAPAQAPAPAAPAPKETPMPSPSEATAQAPETFKARFDTTKGEFVIQVHRAWAPNGADRFYNLVKLGYYTDIAVFRVIDGFMAQMGIHGDPRMNAQWRPARIPDDPAAGQSNTRGMVTYAMAGPNTRTAQIFINFGDNSQLDSMNFPPFGKVVSGMDVVDSLYKGYGEGAPRGSGPDQGRMQMEGNEYLRAEFPKLDYVKSASIVE